MDLKTTEITLQFAHKNDGFVSLTHAWKQHLNWHVKPAIVLICVVHSTQKP